MRFVRSPRPSDCRLHYSKKRVGAVAVEFAIAISILLAVIFASIEFVRLSMLKHNVEHASYLAARTGIIIGATSGDVTNAAQEHLDHLGITNASVTVSPGTITDATNIIEVSIDMPMSGNTWIAPAYFNGTVVGRSRMLAERSGANMSSGTP